MFFSESVAKVLHVNLEAGSSTEIIFPDRHVYLGGSGLAAMLYETYGFSNEPALAPCQPLIFAIGPLTGFFPLMSKTVFGFRSPYTNEWAESHAGGRLALSLRFAGYDALMITGKAKTLSAIVVESDQTQIHDVHFLAGKDVFYTGRFMRRYGKIASGHRSILRIGVAGEKGVTFACTNVDSFRHFGRLGSGAALGAKNIKAIVVAGNNSIVLPNTKEYPKLYSDIFTAVTQTPLMQKYHNMGTAENLLPLNELQALPWRNLQATTDAAVEHISGEYFAKNLLIRKSACSGCPVGCIHIAMLREQFDKDNEYTLKQVGYDFELVFAQGSMLGMTSAQETLRIIDETEKMGLDSMSTGVVLAWCTEALERGIISEQETLVSLRFDDAKGYIEALHHLGNQTNEFWQAVGKGTEFVAKKYNGHDFACSLRQEMAGYATGATFYVAQSLGFRHSHLDTGAYSYDQGNQPDNVEKAVAFLLEDEAQRCTLNSLVGCMFSRKVYTAERCQEALASLGMQKEADNLPISATFIQKKRWQRKFATGFDPEKISIPKRFTEVKNWKGSVDVAYMNGLKTAYGKAIREMGMKE